MVANVALDVCSKVKSEVVPTLPHRECMQQLLKFCLLEIIAEHLGLGIIGECMRYGPIYLLYTLAFAQDTRMSSILPVFDCLLKNFANYSFFAVRLSKLYMTLIGLSIRMRHNKCICSTIPAALEYHSSKQYCYAN